jgi:hypothetical protein
MSQSVFVPGKLRLKSTKPKSAAAKATEKPPPISSPSNASDVPVSSCSTILDVLTPSEAKFLSVNNEYKRKLIEHKAGLSYCDQKRQFNDVLKRSPMHNDLEGE